MAKTKGKKELTINEASEAVKAASEEADAALEAAQKKADEAEALEVAGKVEAGIFKMAEDAEKELAEKKAELIQTVDKMTAAAEAAEKAKKAGNIEAYKAAKDEEADARFYRDVIAYRISELKEPLVNEAEYKSMADTVLKKYSYQAMAYKQRVHDLIEECVKVCQEYKGMCEQADRALSVLQKDIYKCADIPEGSMGDKDYALRFRDTNMLRFVEDTINNLDYIHLFIDVNPRTGSYAHAGDYDRHGVRRYV